MKIHLKDGQEAEITASEASRIADDVSGGKNFSGMEEMCRKNRRYLHRARQEIKRMAGLVDEPDNEDALKDVLYRNIGGISHFEASLLYEVMEALCAMHTKHLMLED